MTLGHWEEDDNDLASGYTGRVLKRMVTYLRPYRLLLTLVLLIVVAAAVLQSAGPLIVRKVVDDYIQAGEADGLGWLVLAYCGTLLGVFVLFFLQAVLITYVGQRVMMDLRLQLFTHVEKMSIAYFDRNPVGRLVTRLTNDVSTIEEVLSQGVVEALYSVLLLITIVAALFYLDWRLAIAMMIFVPGLVFFVSRFALALRDCFRSQRAWLARVNAFLNENITGMAVVQLFNRQARNTRRFDERNRGLLQANLRTVFYYAAFEPSVVAFNAITTAAIIWYGGGRAIDGALTLGTLIAFLQYMQRFYWPVRDLSERTTNMQQAMASCERIFSVLDEPEEIIDDESAQPLGRIEGRVEFRNVWFAYDEDNWVLKDVSFEIEPGEAVAIVGATGAGKSTMMNLLNRFYDVQRGEIVVDGQPVRTLRQRELRRQVGMVLQDPFIFTDSVLENIRLRDKSISEEQVRAAARQVGADAFIERMPQGYESHLAERGANLSTGQKQLIALARVAAFDPKIVLVMDEATASIDPETEAALQKSMREVMSGRTSIIIAHRLNTIRHVSRILVLAAGQVVEEGTHAELLAQGGTYARLYELQYKDQDVGVEGDRV
ncbi:MAG TPA: ABC transporter ATP-binding protein [Dehalococcoidia bacterium]|nr:ABC transporter ATP-binding protein [Dehalococcoidia bacterium]